MFPQEALIDGHWCGSDSGETFPVVNPATGDELARVPLMGVAETRRAIAAAAEAFPPWRRQTAKARGAILRAWADLMRDHVKELAELMTLEQGKPLSESEAEVHYAASFLEWFGEEGKRVYGDTIPQHDPDKRLLVTKQPVGVAVGITPWNFPAAMPTRKAAPALAAGCTMVLKPAEQTPLSACAIAYLGLEAGLPPGVFNVITTDASGAPVVGREFTSNQLVRKLSFTGSTEVGKLLMAQCAQGLKKVSLELGGNAPFIVFDDADLDEAVVGALTCKFRNSGQTCVSANRIFAQERVHDEFVQRYVAAVGDLQVGSGSDRANSVGPLIDEAAVEKVEHHVADAVRKGAHVITGGERHALGGTYFEPTVLVNVHQDMAISCEETFGPVAGITRFSTEDEVVGQANSTPYGLAAYFYSRDIGRIWRVSEALDFGMVGINTGIITTEVAPFGGMKESGMGREGSKYGIEDWLEIKYHCVGGIERKQT